ncbi:hypothetical protein [Niveispirillum cyanobacteriorum]|uniref:Uncharacterized protein n=1 Tax=Niveispirillum cyanobacteriorum TaxID=1612173 RepID=A0A2K9NJN6_9PROT|nr:hypothetical protein [Niveispirillum cyanobacteriorum]AUN33298.1 hypothetical protein C0V82_23285 [Niveispirillum cyanobacteriorum]GGE49869.1 hypothetical protein GCM10011317_05340 [Niveispirillum cyanobacteriorum]
MRGDRGALPPIEQVTQRFHDFVTGRPLVYNQGAKNLDPMVDGVWELKTHDVRIFGWFAAPSCFVAVNGALRSALVSHARFTPFIEEVTQLRNNLPLDEPKFIPGGVLRNVL